MKKFYWYSLFQIKSFTWHDFSCVCTQHTRHPLFLFLTLIIPFYISRKISLSHSPYIFILYLYRYIVWSVGFRLHYLHFSWHTFYAHLPLKHIHTGTTCTDTLRDTISSLLSAVTSHIGVSIYHPTDTIPCHPQHFFVIFFPFTSSSTTPVVVHGIANNNNNNDYLISLYLYVLLYLHMKGIYIFIYNSSTIYTYKYMQYCIIYHLVSYLQHPRKNTLEDIKSIIVSINFTV